MNSTVDTQTNLGVIKYSDKYIDIREGQFSVRIGDLTIDEIVTFEGVRSAINITFQITGNADGYASFRVIKDKLTTKEDFNTVPFTVRSLHGYRKGGVLFPGIKVLDYSLTGWHMMKHVRRIDIEFI